MIPAATLRPGGPPDAPACAAILNAWIDETPWMTRVHAHEDVVRHYEDVVMPRRRVTIAETTRPVGYLALDDEEGFVTSLFVATEARGGGVGKSLLDEAKAARPDGLDLWTFVANLGARRFYEREGFVEAERTDGDNEENLPDIRLRWPA